MATSAHDFQMDRVYEWEQKVVAPLSSRLIDFDDAQSFIDGVWLAHGWLYPPQVEKLAYRRRNILAAGCRNEVLLRRKNFAWVILHELAHTLTMDEEYHGDGHGPEFVGCYIRLLEKVLDIPAVMSIYTLEKEGVEFSWKRPMGPGQTWKKRR